MEPGDLFATRRRTNQERASGRTKRNARPCARRRSRIVFIRWAGAAILILLGRFEASQNALPGAWQWRDAKFPPPWVRYYFSTFSIHSAMRARALSRD